MTNFTRRPYRDARDMDAIRDLLVAGRAANDGTYYIHAGDLAWWFNSPPDEDDRRANVLAWEDDGRLLAWCVHSPGEAPGGDESFDFFAHPAERGSARALAILRDGVDWATARAVARGAKKLTNYWVSEADAVTLKQWAACGFAAAPTPGGPVYSLPLDGELAPPQLPAGFAVCDARTEGDFRLHAQATHGAFGIERPWEPYWEKKLGFFHSPVYIGENSLFVRSPGGRGAAACIIWLDPVNKVGLFEPVGTHPEFQRLGLGTAVMREGLRRMQAAGMRTATVGTGATNAAANALYRSLGFAVWVMSAFLVKEIGEAYGGA